MRQFAIRPDRDLGQNFLVDSNILGVIERAAELRPAREAPPPGEAALPGEAAPHTGVEGVEGGDVVLEIGGGLGVLSEHLAARAEHVHVVEIDKRLREALLDATDAHANVSVHWADVMTMDLAALSPAPTKVVANLPYGVAAGALLRTIEQLPAVELWVAMAQREVGERLAAGAGTSAYGAPSAIAQLACEVRVLRAIPRGVFHPVPHVDSVLVGMRRLAPAPSATVRALVGAAFAHRRKTLARSLVLSGVQRSREEIREAVVELGHPADVRAERLAPHEFVELARMLAL
ncbi:MAG TPA: 16S rRNA (adenine(1518)-N(6)/adenine(1519)-N(6))-dimethyltransferase RsmA [Solirubrobacteraceae bacterium]